MIYITKQNGLNQNKGCLPFGQPSRFTVWVNGKQNSGLVKFTICTNQFHFPKNGLKGLKLVSTMTLNKWNTNFPFEHSDWTNKTTFPDVPLLLLEILRWNDHGIVIHLLFYRIFLETFT